MLESVRPLHWNIGELPTPRPLPTLPQPNVWATVPATESRSRAGPAAQRNNLFRHPFRDTRCAGLSSKARGDHPRRRIEGGGRLSTADRQRNVATGNVGELRRHEQRARRALERPQEARARPRPLARMASVNWACSFRFLGHHGLLRVLIRRCRFVTVNASQKPLPTRANAAESLVGEIEPAGGAHPNFFGRQRREVRSLRLLV